MTSWHERREDGRREWLMQRDEAETVVCPELQCHAPIGEHCCNLLDGRPLEDQPAHWRRIKAANETTPSRPAFGASQSNPDTQEGQ